MMDLAARRQLVEFCLRGDAPPLYKRMFGDRAQVHSESDWVRLPFLTKEILLDTPLPDRQFAPRRGVDHFRVSSGTSGKPPLFSPRTSPRNIEYRNRYHSFQNAILAFTVPTMPHWHESLQMSLGYSPRVIVYDPQNASASIRLARIAGVDAISLFAFHMHKIAELMTAEKMNDRIRFIEICGETCSRSFFEFLRSRFPHAAILPQYGSGEVENIPIGLPCRPITGEMPLALYHVKETHYHEIIDPETLDVLPYSAGTEGELVVSSFPGEPAAFPLIRYRTGDMIRVVRDACAEHALPAFTVLGRVDSDFVKIPGGMLRVDEMERVLAELDSEHAGEFEVHVREHAGQTGPMPEVIVMIERQSAFLRGKDAARAISERLRVGPSRTYAEGVRDGMYLPLSCEPLPAKTEARKRKRIVVHYEQ